MLVTMCTYFVTEEIKSDFLLVFVWTIYKKGKKGALHANAPPPPYFRGSYKQKSTVQKYKKLHILSHDQCMISKLRGIFI